LDHHNSPSPFSLIAIKYLPVDMSENKPNKEV